MKVITFYVQTLAEIEAKFEEETRLSLFFAEDILIKNELLYDGWLVKIIY